MGQGEQNRVKWERNLKFNKICKCFKRKNFKWYIILPILFHSNLSPSSKATTHEISEQSCFPGFSIKSLICKTPKCGLFSGENWWRLHYERGQAGGHGEGHSLPSAIGHWPHAAATLLAPVAMNIWDTEVKWLHPKIPSLSQPHHLHGRGMLLWEAFTAAMERGLLFPGQIQRREPLL